MDGGTKAELVALGDSCITVAALGMALIVECMKGNMAAVAMILLLALVFPPVFVALSFRHSNCVNIDDVLESEIDESYPMYIKNDDGTSRCCTVGEFMLDAFARAKFYLCIAAFLIALVL